MSHEDPVTISEEVAKKYNEVAYRLINNIHDPFEDDYFPPANQTNRLNRLPFNSVYCC